MQCTRCHSHMILTRKEDHQDSYLEWYNCKTCNRTEFISYPARMATEHNYSISEKQKLSLAGT